MMRLDNKQSTQGCRICNNDVPLRVENDENTLRKYRQHQMSENNNQRLKVGITIGDTNGIGIEVCH